MERIEKEEEKGVEGQDGERMEKEKEEEEKAEGQDAKRMEKEEEGEHEEVERQDG